MNPTSPSEENAPAFSAILFPEAFTIVNVSNSHLAAKGSHIAEANVPPRSHWFVQAIGINPSNG
jgi:hypothetical protein